MGGARGGEFIFDLGAWSSGKIYAPGGPSSGLEKALVYGNSKFIFFGQ
jgi:hypothetical protein